MQYICVIFSELEVKENIEGYTFYEMYVLPKNEWKKIEDLNCFIF